MIEMNWYVRNPAGNGVSFLFFQKEISICNREIIFNKKMITIDTNSSNNIYTQ